MYIWVATTIAVTVQYCTRKKKKTTKYEEKECTSVMYTIVYTKYIWTQVSQVTDIWMDNYKYICQDYSFYSLVSIGQELHFNNSYDYK